jgi:hypothetical protein
MKPCKVCHQIKPFDQFYKHARLSDGRLNKCIECLKIHIKAYREKHAERYKVYEQARANLPHRVAQRREYIVTDAGKAARKRATENYRKKYPMKYATKIIFGNAIKNKLIIPENQCSMCASTNQIEGHHDDYTKPLEVRWLCSKCHKQWHKHNQAIYE